MFRYLFLRKWQLLSIDDDQTACKILEISLGESWETKMLVLAHITINILYCCRMHQFCTPSYGTILAWKSKFLRSMILRGVRFCSPVVILSHAVLNIKFRYSNALCIYIIWYIFVLLLVHQEWHLPEYES